MRCFILVAWRKLPQLRRELIPVPAASAGAAEWQQFGRAVRMHGLAQWGDERRALLAAPALRAHARSIAWASAYATYGSTAIANEMVPCVFARDEGGMLKKV